MAGSTVESGSDGDRRSAHDVSYYPDQAQRAQAVGAMSAAVAMYRAALEHFRFAHGYPQRMLGPKINALAEDPNAPAWYRDLDTRTST